MQNHQPAPSPAELAARVMEAEGPSDGSYPRPSVWSEEEAAAQIILITAAIRQERMALIEKALDSFGGIAPFRLYRGRKDLHPLEASARTPKAFGFARLLDACLAQPTDTEGLSLDSSPQDLGRYLRHGLPVAGRSWGDEENRDAGAPVPHRDFLKIGPITAAFKRDNPMALAAILSHPGALAALAATEPAPLESDPTEDESRAWETKVKSARHGVADIEGSLLFCAVACQAPRCARMLLALPEFNAPLLDARKYRQSIGGLGKAFPKDPLFPKPDSPFAEPCLFALAAAHAGRESTRGNELIQAVALLHDAIRLAGPAAQSWRRFGDGAGWPDLAYAGLGMNNCFLSEQEARAMTLLGAMESHGFEPRWPALLAQGCRKDTPMLEWLQAKAESFAIASDLAAPSTQKTSRPSL